MMGEIPIRHLIQSDTYRHAQSKRHSLPNQELNIILQTRNQTTYTAGQPSVTAILGIHVDTTGSIPGACDGWLCPAVLKCREIMFSLLPVVPPKYFLEFP